MLVLEFSVRAKTKVTARVRDSWATKRLGTKRLGYEMSEGHFTSHNRVTDVFGSLTPIFVVMS